MILEQLTITKNNSYDPIPTGYKGQIRIKGKYGAIELSLNHELSAKILAIIGNNAVDSAKELAENLSADVFTVPAIAGKSDDLLGHY